MPDPGDSVTGDQPEQAELRSLRESGTRDPPESR